MSLLLILHRYLVDNKDTDDAYSNALSSLEDFLNVLTELEAWGQTIRNRGNIECSEANDLIEELCKGAQALLCRVADTPTDAVMWLIEARETYLDLDRIVTFIEHRKEQALKKQKEDEALADIDDYPF